jgi:hypothetical protein
MHMKLILTLLLLPLMTACAGTDTYRNSCKIEIDAAWNELDILSSDGFSGSVSYGKAFGLMTSAKTMQTVEKYDNCVGQAKKARYYMNQARQGK